MTTPIFDSSKSSLLKTLAVLKDSKHNQNNSSRQHTYVDHVLPRQKEKKVLAVLVCPVGADVRPPFGFHDCIGNRIPIFISNLTFDSYEREGGKITVCTCDKPPSLAKSDCLLLDVLKGHFNDFKHM